MTDLPDNSSDDELKTDLHNDLNNNSDDDLDDDLDNEINKNGDYYSSTKDTDEEIDEIVKRKIAGEKVDIIDILSDYNSCDKIFEKIKIYENDANCMYHAACCLYEGSLKKL